MHAAIGAEHTTFQLMTVAEVADELRLSYQGCLGMIRRGTVPARKIGKSYRVRREDLTALVTPVPAATATPAHGGAR